MCVADTICHSLSAKPSLKIRTANAIYWISPGIFRDYSLQNFFRNETFFVFQDRKLKLSASVRKEFPETSQSFNSFSSFRQLLISFFLFVVWLSWNFVRFHKILFQTDAESFSSLSWKTKTKYSWEKYFLGCCQYQNKKKALFTDLIFSEGFD